MIRLTVASIAAALVAVVAPATAAHADTEVDQCLSAHPGAVTVDAVTDGNDTVCVGDNQTINGSLGDDTYLWVTADPAHSQTGAHRLMGGPDNIGADPGNDTLSLADWTFPFIDNGMGLWGYRVFGIDATENLILTSYDDTLGDATPGCAPTEVGNTTIDSGAGDDRLSCLSGNLVTGLGDDTVTGASQHAVVDTGDGADTVRDISVQTTVTTDAGADTVDNVLGDSAVNTGDDADTITDVAASTVQAGAGDDVIDTVTDASTIYAGTGNDTITNADASTIYAQAGDDTVSGVAGTDRFVLGAGNDRAFVKGKGRDYVKGGAGHDRVVASRNDHVHSARKVHCG